VVQARLASNALDAATATTERHPMKTFAPVNINNFVRVKLTDFGRKIHREEHERFVKQFPGVHSLSEYTAPKEDDRGWSKWQLWCLMETFGEHCVMGHLPPFETTIEIEVEISEVAGA
jgi:hypothetical protein